MLNHFLEWQSCCDQSWNLKSSLSENKTRVNKNAVDSRRKLTLSKNVALRTVSKPISTFSVITAVQGDPGGTKQYTSNNKDAFKYRDHRTQLPACFPDSTVISWGLDNSLCPVLSRVWCGGGQSNLAPQMSSHNRMLLSIQSGKLQHAYKTDVISAQIIGKA